MNVPYINSTFGLDVAGHLKYISQAKISSTLGLGFHSIGKVICPHMAVFQSETSAKLWSIANLLLRNERTDRCVVIEI